MKITESVCDPDTRTVPAAGEYTNVPATLDVAFNCEALNAVPYVIPAGAAQVIVAMALFTVSATLAEAVL